MRKMPLNTTRDTDYPDDGVTLGLGWDSISGAKKDIRGIAFAEAQESGQKKDYRIEHITDRNKLMKDLQVSAEAKFKYLTYGIGAKAGFANKVTISETFTSFALLANVENGVYYTAPIEKNQSSFVTSLFAKGKTSAEVNEEMKIDPVTYSEQYPLESLNESEANFIRTTDLGIWLSDDAVKLIKDKGPDVFRRKYGDSFVSAIYGGGQLNVVMTFKTYSLEEQNEIKASMGTSGLSLDIKAEAIKKMEKFSERGKLEINYHQLGGKGDPMSTNVDEFREKIKALPDLAAKDPHFYKITLKRYDSLPNWPSAEKFGILAPAYEELVRRYYEYKDIYDEIDYIKNHCEDYVIIKDLQKDPNCPNIGITVKSLNYVQDELHEGITGISKVFKDMEDKEPEKRDYAIPKSATKPDYEFRIALPLTGEIAESLKGSECDKINSFREWDVYKEAVINKWIVPISQIRGQMYSIADPGCLDNKQIEKYKSKVYYLAIVGGIIEIKGKESYEWGEPDDKNGAEKLPIVDNKKDGTATSYFYLTGKPATYRKVVGIYDANKKDLLWGTKTDKKVNAVYLDNWYLEFYLESSPQDSDGEKIVGGIGWATKRVHFNFWGHCSKKVVEENERCKFYISS
jgi:hypothetical protein